MPILKGVNFDYDKSILRPDAFPVLDEVAETLARYPEIRVEIGGHTDWNNSDAYNQRLSERRAQSVMDYLVSKGIAANRMAVKGYGEAKPIADNNTENGRFQNRRVELRILN